MSPEIIGFIGIAALLVLVFLRVWVGFAMALVGLAGYVYLEGWARAASMVGSEPTPRRQHYLCYRPIICSHGCGDIKLGVGKDLYDSASTGSDELGV